MCGRYASFREAQDLADAFALAEIAEDARLLPPSWNVAPTDGVRMVVERPERLEDGTHGEIVRTLRAARWGLVPSWAKDPSIGNRMINARSEGLADKPAFQRAFATRRALLPSDGYYEWKPPDDSGAGARPRTKKQPFYIHPPDGGVLALAGLYEFWKDPTKADNDPDRWLVSAAVVTVPATGELAHIHDRQPLMLRPEDWDAWLDPAKGAREASALLMAPPPDLVATPVSTAVNTVANDGPELVREVEEPTG